MGVGAKGSGGQVALPWHRSRQRCRPGRAARWALCAARPVVPSHPPCDQQPPLSRPSSNTPGLSWCTPLSRGWTPTGSAPTTSPSERARALAPRAARRARCAWPGPDGANQAERTRRNVFRHNLAFDDLAVHRQTADACVPHTPLCWPLPPAMHSQAGHPSPRAPPPPTPGRQCLCHQRWIQDPQAMERRAHCRGL
jgi:hypothetical protein